MSWPRGCTMCLLVFALLAFVCGCDKSVLPPLGRVTLIKVTKDRKEIRANISDEQSIRKIIEFVEARNKGWEKPLFGTPLPTINAEFYDGEDQQASFGIGKGAFETQRRDEFWSKTATPDETGRFLDLLGIPREYLN
jgi:hypothetical protein